MKWGFEYLVQVRVVDWEVCVVHLKHLIWIAGLLVLMVVTIVVMLSVRKMLTIAAALFYGELAHW